MRPAWTLNPSIGLLCWLEKSGPKDLGLFPQLRGLSGIQMGPGRGGGGTSAAVYGQSSGIRLSIYREEYAVVFQAEIYAILACEYEILMDVRPEKYISIFSDREWGDFESCQKNFSIGTTVPKGAERHFYPAFCGAVWVPGHSRVRGNEIADELAREGTVRHFVGPEPAWGSLGRI